MNVLYADNIDARCAAAVAVNEFKNINLVERFCYGDCVYNHKKMLSSGDELVLVGINILKEEIEDLSSWAKKVYYFTRDRKSYNNTSEISNVVRWFCDESLSKGVYEYFETRKTDKITVALPQYIQYMNSYILDDKRFGETPDFVVTYIENSDADPQSDVWKGLILERRTKILRKYAEYGSILMRAFKSRSVNIAVNNGYTLKIFTYRYYIVNTQEQSFRMFDTVKSGFYDIYVLYYFNGSNFVVKAMTTRTHINLKRLFSKFNADGTERVVTFACSVETFPFFNSHERIQIDDVGNYSLSNPIIPEIITDDATGKSFIYVRELDVYGYGDKLSVAIADAKRKIYDILRRIRDGRPVSEINPKWNIDDISRVCRYVREHLVYHKLEKVDFNLNLKMDD